MFRRSAGFSYTTCNNEYEQGIEALKFSRTKDAGLIKSKIPDGFVKSSKMQVELCEIPLSGAGPSISLRINSLVSRGVLTVRRSGNEMKPNADPKIPPPAGNWTFYEAVKDKRRKDG